MRSLTPHNATETVKQQTEPFYLVHLGFDVPLYLCSLKDLTLDTITWSASRQISVNPIKTDTSGNQSGAIKLSDGDNLIAGLVLSEGCAGKSATIYKGYGLPTSTDLVLLFDGVMDGSRIVDDQVTITLLGKNAIRFSPGVVIAPPYFNHLPPAGTVIKSGNTTITLNRGPR